MLEGIWHKKIYSHTPLISVLEKEKLMDWNISNLVWKTLPIKRYTQIIVENVKI
jgi:hypothetical protein